MSFLSLANAFLLGLMASIVPCALAQNVAAVTFLSRGISRPWRVALTGLAYTAGRVAAYLGLGVLLTWGIFSVPGASRFLQEYMNRILGPLLIVAGLVVLEWLPLPMATLFGGKGLQDRAGTGAAWAALLGAILALAFCPVTAGLFFGGLVPLALHTHSIWLIPLVFGAGTAIPVVGFSILIAAGGRLVARAFDKVSQAEKWARRATGAAFIGVGVFYCLAFTLKNLF